MKKKSFVLPLALALTLPAVGARTQEQTPNSLANEGTALQAPAAPPLDPPLPQGTPPDGAPPGRPAPGEPVPAPPAPAEPGPGEPGPIPAAPDQQPPAPDAVPPDPAPTDQAPPDEQPPPAPAAPDVIEPAPAPADPAPLPNEFRDPQQVDPAAPQPVEPQPVQPEQPAPGVPDPLQPDRLPQQPPQPDQPPQADQPVQPDQPAQPQQPMVAPDPNAMPAGTTMNPLQEFVSHQSLEIGMLSRQMDHMRAANRNDAVMAMYHMIRDHTLVSDAARNTLARRGEISRPFPMMMTQPMAQTPEEIISQQLRHHEEEQGRLQQLIAGTNVAEERNIYQRALNVVNKHLSWLRPLSQGQAVQIGYFGPTTPLSLIAGYRETASAGQATGSQQRVRRQRAAEQRARRSSYRGNRRR